MTTNLERPCPQDGCAGTLYHDDEDDVTRCTVCGEPVEAEE